MIVGDVLLDRSIPADDLRAAVAAAFSVPAEHVALVSGMENAPRLTGVTLDVNELGGDYPMHVTIYAADAHAAEVHDLAAAIAQHLAVVALVPSDSVDPYKMTLIKPDGATVEVDVDVESLDNYGEYRLARTAGLR